jgi:hypothetical protein
MAKMPPGIVVQFNWAMGPETCAHKEHARIKARVKNGRTTKKPVSFPSGEAGSGRNSIAVFGYVLFSSPAIGLLHHRFSKGRSGP